MERYNFVKNGVLRLPPGFRFHPTDEELVMQYLRRKVLACPLPASIIPEVDVCKSDPWDLPGDAEQERYFFSTREAKYPNGNRSNRATVSGYWKATGIDRKIVSCKGTHVVGMKKTLVFYRGKPPTGSKTDWIMHEYRLAEAPQPPKMNLDQIPVVPIENWVLCRIFLKKRSSKADDTDKTDFPCKEYEVPSVENIKNSPVFYEFLKCDKSPSSSGSSGITRVTSNNDGNNNNNNFNQSEDNEESSSCNSFSFTYLGSNNNVNPK